MNKENTQKLIEKYPNLYKDYHGDMRTTCMCWGFEHGDGWYDIIDELSKKLERLGVVAVQVKEKYGGLRFYISGGSEEIYALIDEAEAKSYKICELCGEEGKLSGMGWVKTLCDSCKEERGY